MTALPATSITPSGNKRKLVQRRIQQAEFARNIFDVTPDTGTSLDEMLDEAYWANVASMLNPKDRIEVLAEDNSFFAELLVLSTSKLAAKVVVLRSMEIGKVDRETVASDNSRCRVEWKGGNLKWCAIRDNDIIRDGFATEAEAERWKKNHEDALTR